MILDARQILLQRLRKKIRSGQITIEEAKELYSAKHKINESIINYLTLQPREFIEDNKIEANKIKKEN
jgi:hypothetical protein